MSSLISGNDREDSSAELYDGQLLKDIKEVSRALYSNNPPQTMLSLSPARSKSVSRTTDIGLLLPSKKKKSWVAWDWKKPLKSIAHLGQSRFDVCFLVHVHSIEGLPSNLDGTKLVVQCKRKDEVMSTQPSKVLQGTAEFEETFMHRCSVYGSKHGPYRSARYQVKLFLVYASLVDDPWTIVGKSWIDLTRILPLSLEELESTKSTRKWNTSFKLSGLADSAVLNLSFEYSVSTNSVCDLSSRNVMLKRVGSVQNMNHTSSSLDDREVNNQVLPSLSLDLSQSIDVLYEKLSEQNPKRSTSIDIQDEHMGKTKVDVSLETDKQMDDSKGTDLTYSEKGVEMFQQKESSDLITESSNIEIIDINEILKDEDESVFEETYFIDQLSVAELNSGASNILPEQSVFREPKSALSSQVNSKSSEIKSPSSMDDSTEKEKFLEVKSSYRAAKVLTKSLSLDEITESIANDFLKMLERDNCSYVYTSDDESTSPREYLLQEFEKEAFASGNLLFDVDAEAEYVSEIHEESNNFSFSSSTVGIGEDKHEGKTEMLINRRKAKVLKDLEIDTILRELDLKEVSVENSLCDCSDGFGSPIELPVDEALDSLPLKDNVGSTVWTKGGGCIRPMSTLLFRKCKDVSHLIMQVSTPVVLVSELGSDILEIIQSLAASGIEGLCAEVNALMPLEEIMGKTINEIFENTRFERNGHDCSEECKGAMVQKPSGELHSSSSKEENFGGFGSNMVPGEVPLEDLLSLAVDGIELLSLEGLKIQCNMSVQDPPSVIAPKPMDQSEALELISLSLTLDEWLRLHHGMPENEVQTSKQMRNKIFAHHAYQDQAHREKDHTSSSKLTLALQVLLRDPLRNNEPVGASMLALVQVERSLVSSDPLVCSLTQEGRTKKSFECDTYMWRITNMGLAGLKTEPGVDHPWCTKTQQQSGSRWLLASGTDETFKCQTSKSKAITVFNPQTTRKTLDTLWSIMTDRHNQEGVWSSTAAYIPFTRNEDVICSNEITKRF